MPRPRVIPCLLIDRGRLVKTVGFSDPRYVGDPVNAVKIFNEKRVDELFILDISATKDDREPDFSLIERIAGEAFMPLSYGGGIRSTEQADRLFRSGVEKIVVNSAALADPRILKVLSGRFGSSSVVASVDLRRTRRGAIKVRGVTSRSATDVIGLLKTYQEAEVGEILVQSVDQDGTLKGPALDLIGNLPKMNVPVVYAGGIGSLSDVRSVIDAGADAVAAGAFFVFHGTHRAVLITYPGELELVNVFGRESST